MKIERDVLKPFLRGEDIKAYSIAKPTQYVIVPYHVIEGHATLIDAKALKKDSPLCWEYLLKNREALENREKGKMKHERILALQKERQSVRREDDLDRVRNLERQIAQVDAEIDQRVYALYGLTEDEIKIVEGKA